MADTLTTLATLVGARLQARGLLMASAESCTGGWVAEAMTAIAGSSAWFERGFVTYSNLAKSDMLGVPVALIERHGAVSEPVAAAMSEGALHHSAAQVAVAITGVAGPSGGSVEKPVGTVCFSWSIGRKANIDKTIHESKHFHGDREAVRRQSVIHALQGILSLLDNTG